MTENTSSLISITWEKAIQSLTANTPSPREGSICAYIPEQNKLLVFGGQGAAKYNDLYSYDFSNGVWSELKTQGVAPPLVSHAASWYDAPYLFFHGGRSHPDKSLGDTFFLDIETYTWRKIFSLEQPSSTYGHTAVKTDEKQAYVFGGCNIGKKAQRFLGDLHRFEYKSIKIVEGDHSNVNGASWINNVACKGVKPAGRKGHSMIFIHNNIFIYGGELKTGITDDALYRFSIDDKEWTVVNIANEKLPLNAYSSICLIDESHMMIYGGKGKDGITDEIISFNHKTMTVGKIQQSETSPGKRMNYSVCYNQENQMMVLGGNDDKGFGSMDIYILKEVICNEVKNKAPIKEEKDNKTKVKTETTNHPVLKEQITMEEILPQRPIQPQIQSKPQQHQSNIEESQLKFQEKYFQATVPKTVVEHKTQSIIPSQSHKQSNRVEELKKLQATFIQLYEKNNRLEKNLAHQNSELSSICKQDIRCHFIEKEIKDLQEKKSKNNIKREGFQEMNASINSYLHLNKERFTLLSEFISFWIEDLIKMDKILMITNNKDIIYSSINYDDFNEKRKLFYQKLIEFYSSVHLYSMYENEKYNIILQKKKVKKNPQCSLADHKTLSFRGGIEGDSLEFNNN